MSGSPLKNEFLAEGPAIDNMMGLPREGKLDGWLLSSSTMVYSTKNLSKARRPSTSSDSDTTLIDDPRSWSGSDTAVEDLQLSDTDLWDSFFEPQEKIPLPQPFHLPCTSPLRIQRSKLSFNNRNFACSNLQGLNNNSECPAEPYRLEEVHLTEKAEEAHQPQDPFRTESSFQLQNPYQPRDPCRAGILCQPEVPYRSEIHRREVSHRRDESHQPQVVHRSQAPRRPYVPHPPEIHQPDVPYRREEQHQTEVARRPQVPRRPQVSRRPQAPHRSEISHRQDVPQQSEETHRSEIPLRPKVPLRSEVPRTPRRRPRTPKSLPHNTYSPFPAIPPTPEIITSSHVSWPLRQGPPLQRPPVRPRAHTTPTESKPTLPSNLSACTTLDGHSPSHSTASSSSGLYMRSSPMKPQYYSPPPPPPPALMELMEKSYFDDDSDDEESGLAALASKFSLRSPSSSGPSGSKGRELRMKKSMKNLRAASDAFKGMFGMKKGCAS